MQRSRLIITVTVTLEKIKLIYTYLSRWVGCQSAVRDVGPLAVRRGPLRGCEELKGRTVKMFKMLK
jgi:hypothetical protein